MLKDRGMPHQRQKAVITYQEMGHFNLQLSFSSGGISLDDSPMTLANFSSTCVSFPHAGSSLKLLRLTQMSHAEIK